MSEPINLLATTDAMVWAQEFVRLKKECGWSLDSIDEGLMVGWFANAIETARAAAPQPTDEMARLERRLAKECAEYAIMAVCEQCGDWFDTKPPPNNKYYIYSDLRYLELRGLLERHPDNPNMVRIKAEAE